VDPVPPSEPSSGTPTSPHFPGSGSRGEHGKSLGILARSGHGLALTGLHSILSLLQGAAVPHLGSIQ